MFFTFYVKTMQLPNILVEYIKTKDNYDEHQADTEIVSGTRILRNIDTVGPDSNCIAPIGTQDIS